MCVCVRVFGVFLFVFNLLPSASVMTSSSAVTSQHRHTALIGCIALKAGSVFNHICIGVFVVFVFLLNKRGHEGHTFNFRNVRPLGMNTRCQSMVMIIDYTCIIWYMCGIIDIQKCNAQFLLF